MTGSKDLTNFLARHSVVGIDSSPFIYYVEEHPTYLTLTSELFEAVERQVVSAVTSTVSLLELLVRPLREGNIRIVKAIYAVAPRHPHILWVPPSLSIAARGAELRAQYNLRTPDALQVATAIEGRATGFVTNDRRLVRVTELDVLVLDDAISRT